MQQILKFVGTAILDTTEKYCRLIFSTAQVENFRENLKFGLGVNFILKKIITCIILILVFCYTSCTLFAQETIIVKRGTEVLVKVIEKIKSNKVKTGQTLQFLVERAVKDENGFTVIEQGAFAYGSVIKASSAGLLGIGGKLEITIDSVEAYNGRIIQLTGTKDNDGSSTGAVIAGALLISPLAIFFRGTNATIDAVTIFRAYVAKNTVLSGDIEPRLNSQTAFFKGNTNTDKQLNEILKKYENEKNN